jgi:hypothetical protein
MLRREIIATKHTLLAESIFVMLNLLGFEVLDVKYEDTLRITFGDGVG